MDFQNATIVLSEEINDILRVVSEPSDLKTGEVYVPQVAFYLLPNTTSGWHNGTLSIAVLGEPLPENLKVNVLVPQITASTYEFGPNATMTTMVTPSYSPYFSNVVDVVTWLTYNGTSILVRYDFDVFVRNATENALHPPITIQTDKHVYALGSDSYVQVSGTVRNDTVISGYDSVYLAVYNDDRSHPHKYHASIKLDENGQFSHRMPLNGSLASEDEFTISGLFRGERITTKFNVTNPLAAVNDLPVTDMGTNPSDDSPAVSSRYGLVRSVDVVPVGDKNETLVNRNILGKAGTIYNLDYRVFNTEMNPVSFQAITEIRNAAGVTMDIIVEHGTIERMDTVLIEPEWIPKAPGTYSILSFLISDLENPDILIEPATTYAEIL